MYLKYNGLSRITVTTAAIEQFTRKCLPQLYCLYCSFTFHYNFKYHVVHYLTLPFIVAFVLNEGGEKIYVCNFIAFEPMLSHFDPVKDKFL